MLLGCIEKDPLVCLFKYGFLQLIIIGYTNLISIIHKSILVHCKFNFFPLSTLIYNCIYFLIIILSLALSLTNPVLLLIPLLILIATNEHSMLEAFVLTFYSKLLLLHWPSWDDSRSHNHNPSSIPSIYVVSS